MLRIEYESVVSYHGYRQDQPWDVPGAVRLLHLDGVNGPREVADAVYAEVRALELRVLSDARRDGVPAQADNHYGFTVATRSGQRLHLRFSDGSLYVWLMPDPVPVPAVRSVTVSDPELPVVWDLLYNVLSQGGWPYGLDEPRDPDAVLAVLARVESTMSDVLHPRDPRIDPELSAGYGDSMGPPPGGNR